MTRAVSVRFATTTGRSPIRTLRHSWNRFRLRSPDRRRSAIPLAAQRRLVSANVDALRSTLRRLAATALDTRRAASPSLDNPCLISQSPPRYRFVVFAPCQEEVMSKQMLLPSHIINRVKWLIGASTVYQAVRFRKQAAEMPDRLR